jgi:uncharacterized iron-regulated membrane protein
MYHWVRGIHRWLGLIGAFFLAMIAVTGFLLATKDSLGWVKPETQSGEKVSSLAPVISLHSASEAVFALGIPELRSHTDIERMDYRPEKNVFKIVSQRGYHEVQVCGSTGKVLSVAKRVDQLTEDIHDFRYFADWLHLYWLPVVSGILLGLAMTGIAVYVVPYVRRARYRRSKQ